MQKDVKGCKFYDYFWHVTCSHPNKQKSFITVDIIGTIQNNRDLVINYENVIMLSMWNINRGKFCFKSTKLSYVCLLFLMCGDIE